MQENKNDEKKRIGKAFIGGIVTGVVFSAVILFTYIIL